jgi:uncharacterized protein YegP (UPF0339 family)
VCRKFEIKKTGARKYHFVLKASNGEIIATCEPPKTVSSQSRSTPRMPRSRI